MSDFNSSYYTPPYIPPSYFLPPPPPPMITPENPGAINAYYQQQQQQIANSGGAGYSPFNPATSPNTAPSGMTYPGAGMVQPYPSFGEAGNYGRLPDDSYQPEQAFSPSGGAGGYTPSYAPQSLEQYNSNPFRGDDWTMPNADAATFWQQQAPTNYVPEQSWGGYTPADNFSTRFPVNQSQSPSWQPSPSVFDTGTSPTPYFNDFLVPQYSQSFQQYLSNPFRGDDWTGDSVYGGGSASAAAGNQGNVYGGGAASAAPAYNPFNQYANGGYDPFSAQTYQPAAQQNVGGARGYSAQSLEQYNSNPFRGDEGYFDDRYSASPGIPTGLASDPYSFPPAITTGAQPSPDLPRVPDNFNTRFAPVAGESMYSPSDFPGWTAPTPNFDALQRYNSNPFRGDEGYDAPAYNPFQQYQNSGYNPFVSSYENDLNSILRGIDQGPAPGPSYAPPDTLQQGDYGSYGGPPMPARGSADWYGQGWDMLPESTLNAMNQMHPRDAIAQAIVEQPPSMADFQSPANDYNTFQEPSSTPAWQKAIPEAYRDSAAIEAMKNTAFATIDPRALSTLFNVESTWNPQNRTGEQYGIAQMAKDDFNYGGAGGTLGGLTFEQYKGAPAADQIGAYADLLARIQQRNPGLDFSSMTPQRQYAVLQALNFGPYTGEPGTIQWIKAMNEGNTSIPTTNKPQADEVGDTSINAMEQAYLRRTAGW